MEITDHPIFDGVDWTTLAIREFPNLKSLLLNSRSVETAPTGLHLPQFTYSEPKELPNAHVPPTPARTYDESASISQGFAFSAFFQHSSTASPGISVLRPGSLSASTGSTSSATASFIGFSWGPRADAFPDNIFPAPEMLETTPRPQLRTPAHVQQTPLPATLSVPGTWGPGGVSSPLRGYSTPLKPYALSPHATLPRTSTIRRTAPKRAVSDREAMKQLVDCVGMSARKKVLESGRKPRIIGVVWGSNTTGSKHGTASTSRKELRFDRFAIPIPGPDYSGVSSTRSRSRSQSNSHSNSRSFSHIIAQDNQNPQPNPNDTSDIYYYSTEVPNADQDEEPDPGVSFTETTDSENGCPPSPSPSPRPGSAMSMMSMTMLSKRSGTPTVSGYLSGTSSALRRMRSGSGFGLNPSSDRSLTATMTMTGTTSSGFLSIPSAGAEKLDFRLGQPPLARDKAEEVQLPSYTKQDGLESEKDQGTAILPSIVRTTSSSLGTKFKPVAAGNAGKPATSRPRSSTIAVMSSSGLRLEEMERRHASMMQDIGQLEDRFDEVTAWIRL